MVVNESHCVGCSAVSGNQLHGAAYHDSRMGASEATVAAFRSLAFLPGLRRQPKGVSEIGD